MKHFEELTMETVYKLEEGERCTVKTSRGLFRPAMRVGPCLQLYGFECQDIRTARKEGERL